MKKGELRRLYERPWARDLSVLGVNGGPLGECLSGGKPYTQCVMGNTVGTGGSCAVGYRVDTKPACQTGSVALIGCSFGSQAP